MRQFLHFVCVLAHLYMLTAKQYANVNIHGGSLKVINYNSETSKDLLGVTFYQGLPALKDHNKLKMFRDELGVNTVSFAQTATEMLFPTSGWRWNCCNNVNDLRKNLIWSGEACRNFANAYTPSIFADPFFVSTGITPFIMVRDVCAPDNPATRHCVKPMTDWQSGIPLNGDGWWTELLSAYVTCALKVRKDLKYFHLWNEPNAFFEQTDKKYDGKYFTNFYQDVVTKIKKEHPQILMGGPVTWNIAAYQDDWENWWVPFLDRTLTSNPRTLDFFDWHCYDHGGNNQQAEWDVVVAMSESISLYAGLKYGQYLKNSITETNYKLKDWENSNRATNFKRRSIMNAKQVVGLSHIPDKFDKRLIYDAHAKGWEWLDSPEFQSQKVLKYLLGRKLVDFEVQHDNSKPSNRQGTFFNQDIMTQVVYDTKQKKSYTVIVNDNENEEVVVTLTDLDKKYRFQNPAKMAKLNGNNVDFGVYWIGTSNEKAYITMKPKSVAVVDANVISTPQQTVTQQEFRSGLDCMMKKISWQGSWICGIQIWKSGNNPRRAKLKMGLFYGAFGYKWDVKVELNNQVLLDTKNYVPVLRYNEFPLSAAAFKKTGWMKVSFTMRNNKNGWIPPARLGYVAATVDYA